MVIGTRNIDIIPVLRDAGVELSSLSAIEIAPMPEGGIELVEHYSDSMVEEDSQKYRLYLCQQDTGYFCQITEELKEGRIGRTGEVLTQGSEDVYVPPVPFFKEGIQDDEAIVVIRDYAWEQWDQQMEYGTGVVIYYPR